MIRCNSLAMGVGILIAETALCHQMIYSGSPRYWPQKTWEAEREIMVRTSFFRSPCPTIMSAMTE